MQDLNKSQNRMLRYIRRRCKETGSCSLSYIDIKDDFKFTKKPLRYSERQAVRLIKALLDKGYVRMVSKGGGRGKTNIYEVAGKNGRYPNRVLHDGRVD